MPKAKTEVAGKQDTWVMYQAVLSDARQDGRREVILLIGKERLGKPDWGNEARLMTMRDPKKLMKIAERLLTASSWDELINS